MLLEFKTKNFKMFKDDTTFSMIPAPKIKDLDYSVLKASVGKKQYKGLSSAVIYGPNAAGKTNILSAIDVFKSIVLKGSIRNGDYTSVSPNETVKSLELIPNASYKEAHPVEFRIKFIDKGFLYNYGITIDLGVFLDTDYDRSILEESLYINEKMIFERTDTLTIGDVIGFSSMLVSAFDSSVSEKMAQSNLNKKELFLTGLFKSLYSAEIVNNITDWFRNKCNVYLEANHMVLNPRFDNEDTNQVFVNDTINQAIEQFGIHGNKIAYIKSKDNDNFTPYSVFDNGRAVPVRAFESYGTQRFLNSFPVIFDTLKNGATLIVDEFDASIHPMVLMSIIGAFHNDEINKNGAQLIFNTHNPIFLNRNLFRRDEIKFVDKDDDTGVSIHYSLSDFGTSGPNGVRNTEDYMKNYFVSRYGSIRNVDFSDLLKERMESAVNEKG